MLRKACHSQAYEQGAVDWMTEVCLLYLYDFLSAEHAKTQSSSDKSFESVSNHGDLSSSVKLSPDYLR